ncbi:uncharacterized protein LOC143542953 [Bidens hawaiensis]|uniref:uncharacterized protein LOC143542953 n=1 Tax=Bidens hawaiensis TaxID=980011 RepID=UPI00404A7DCC
MGLPPQGRDHVTGSGLIKKSKVPGVKSIISKASKASADILVEAGDKIQFGDLYLEVRETPGIQSFELIYINHYRAVNHIMVLLNDGKQKTWGMLEIGCIFLDDYRNLKLELLNSLMLHLLRQQKDLKSVVLENNVKTVIGIEEMKDTLDETSTVQEDLNENTKKLYQLLEDGNEELFPGCKSFSKLSCIVRLLLYKTDHGLSNMAFDEMLQFLQKMIPEAKLPASFTQAKKITRDIGLNYKKIHACPNDCMLYWKEYEDAEVCHICHTSKWKQVNEKQNNYNSEHYKTTSRVPTKVVWHFPLKPRLQRLFMCSEIAKHMRWHDEGCPKDGNLRHPVDGKSWKEFDSLYPHFAKETRNVRLGLSSDGFNPFGTMSIAHSTWHVVLVNYNLPPWMSQKPEYFILSLLIPGPESPGNNIDIYLQPLVEELKDLWVNGLETYDKSKDETFKMYAALTWTISDFPGYSMLSGWKTKGTLLDISGKSKDHPKARFDLLDLKIKEKLQPKLSDDGKHVIMEKACFSMFSKEKVNFCRVLKETKLPYACASNIARCVHSSEKKFSGYKSHDAHIFLHYLLQVAVRKSLPKLNKVVEDNDGFKGENKSNEPMFVNGGHPLGGKKRRQGKVTSFNVHLIEQAHRYALFNSDCEQVNDYINEHEAYIENQPRQSRWARAQNHSHEFAGWFETKFHTKSRDSKCITQNSGVSLTTLTPSFASSRDKNLTVGNVDYYGRILDVIELDYWSKFRVVLFRCEWYQREKDDYGLTCINLKLKVNSTPL